MTDGVKKKDVSRETSFFNWETLWLREWRKDEKRLSRILMRDKAARLQP